MTSIKIIKNTSKLHVKLLQKSRLKHHLFIFSINIFILFHSFAFFIEIYIQNWRHSSSTCEFIVSWKQWGWLEQKQHFTWYWHETHILYKFNKNWTSNLNCKQVTIGASFELRTPLRTFFYKPQPTTNHLF